MTDDIKKLIEEARNWLASHPNTHSARRTDVRCLADALEAAEATIARIDTALRGDDRSAVLVVTAQGIITEHQEASER